VTVQTASTHSVSQLDAVPGQVSSATHQSPGEALFQQVVQSSRAEELAKDQFDKASPEQRLVLADEFIEVAGEAGINQLAETQDGQHALKTVFNHASETRRQFMRDVHVEQGNTAIDYTRDEQGGTNVLNFAQIEQGDSIQGALIQRTINDPSARVISDSGEVIQEGSKFVDPLGGKGDLQARTLNVSNPAATLDVPFQDYGLKDAIKGKGLGLIGWLGKRNPIFALSLIPSDHRITFEEKAQTYANAYLESSKEGDYEAAASALGEMVRAYSESTASFDWGGSFKMEGQTPISDLALPSKEGVGFETHLNGATVLIYPTEDSAGKPQVEIYPAHESDPADQIEVFPLIEENGGVRTEFPETPPNWKDGILVFPVDSGIPPMLVVYQEGGDKKPHMIQESKDGNIDGSDDSVSQGTLSTIGGSAADETISTEKARTPSGGFWEQVDPVSLEPLTLQHRLKGTGQIAALRRNPNLKGINIDQILNSTPEALEQMVKDGELTAKQLKTIKKSFEGRDLRHGK
jgi:hypothetical protein